jgi:hypothetical protein
MRDLYYDDNDNFYEYYKSYNCNDGGFKNYDFDDDVVTIIIVK